MNTLRLINYTVSILFVLCYAYQFVYIPISLFKKKKTAIKKPDLRNFAVLICARNEAAVIGDLIDSIKYQTYNKDLITVFVLADNCTDNTAAIAKLKGAKVYSRFNKDLVGKGYALQELRQHIAEDYPEGFDGYFVFDADNILSPNYIEEMNKTFSEGNDIITSYRNSKNYGDNWISAGYALWFLRESRYLNNARDLIGTSCMVSGTGFLFSKKIAENISDWPFHTLTEDIEFSADLIVNGYRIAFCPAAEFYDEQPTGFAQSWRQRLRWSKGYLQVFRKYGKRMIKGCMKGNFSCFDMTMSIMPAFILSAMSVILNLVIGVRGAYAGDDITIALKSIGEMLGNMYLTLFAVGIITTVSEWKHIKTSAKRKIAFSFTFPLFMFTYIPISIRALFGKCEWKPIIHSVSASDMLLKSGKTGKTGNEIQN